MKFSQQGQHTIKGFSLIELMIAVAIVGILAAIAYPSYTDYILRSHRAEGKAMLTQAQVNQERFFTDNNTYSSTLAGLGYTAPAKSENEYYELTIVGPTTVVAGVGCPINSCYAMTVTAKTSQLKDTSCRSFTLTATGRKTAEDSGGTASTDCWRK